MFFERSRLHKCNRTSLAGYETIEITPSTKTQMVLGTNSSGKSSLLHIAFSPIAPDPNDFDDGGSWYVRVHHKGRVYDLEAHYGDKNSYSFIVDGGENLNKGRTITVQHELEKEHFGYQKDLHNFLTGAVEFTSMVPTTRRDWIARFSAEDFDFGFRKYNEWKKELAGHSKVVNWLKERLVEAREKLIDEDDLAAMRAKANELHETLEVLMREPRHADVPLTDDEMHSRIDEIDDLLVMFLTTEYPDTYDVNNLEDLITACEAVGVELMSLQGEAKVRGERFAECDMRREKIEKAMEIKPEDLEADIAAAKAELATIPPLVTGIHQSLLINASTPIAKLRMAIAGLPPERKSESDLMSLNEVVFEKRITHNKVGGLLDDLQRQIDHIHRCESVGCPACGTQFKPGIAPGSLETLQERVAKGLKIKEQADAELSDIEDKLQDTASIVEAYNQVEEIRAEYQKNYPGLFAYLDDCGWTNIGQGLNGKLAIYERDVIYSDRQRLLNESVDWQQATLDRLKAEAGDSDKVMEEYRQAAAEYDSVHFAMQEVVKRKRQLDEGIAKWRSYIGLSELAERKYAELRQNLIGYCNHQGDIMIEDLILRTKKSIGVHEFALSEQETHMTLVKDYENQLKAVLIEEQACKLLVDAMCPKKGFLGERIGESMTSIVDVVNKIIARVWGYPLYLHPCGADDNGIDYKFPFTVNTQYRGDISQGSKSVKEVINQAFRWAAYYCMNLYDYPLYLDELGAAFDEAHKLNLIPLIKDLIDDNHFSQVFIISHEKDGQTSFPNSETTILDDRNISYPHPYNEHVEFS